MIRGSFIKRSTSAYRNHDLQLIAILDQGLLVQALRHDLAVAFDRDLLAREFELGEKRRYIERLLERMHTPVHGNAYHGMILSLLGFHVRLLDHRAPFYDFRLDERGVLLGAVAHRLARLSQDALLYFRVG